MKKSVIFSSLVHTNTLLALLVCILFFSCKTPQKVATVPVKQNEKKQLSEKERIDFEYIFFNGSKEKILGNYDLAETHFAQALRINPNSAAAMYELANIYAFQNNNIQALYYSKKAATLEPKNIWYQLLYAECLKSSKQPGDVAVVFQKLTKDHPDRIEFYYELANAYLYTNKPVEAIKVYDKVEERTGVTEDASVQKLKIYKGLNNHEKAIEEAKKLIKAFPKEAKFYGMLGELYQEKGLNEKALETYNELLRIDPSNAYVHLSLADYYRNNNQNEKAFEEIKVAFRSKDLDIDTKIKILLSYYSITENFPELKPDADELCKILVEVHPDDAKSFSMYGDFLYRDKKLEEARTQYRKAISLDKEKYALWDQLLRIDLELEDYVSLQKESKETLELFPNQAPPYFLNGASNYQLKNYKEAIEVLTEGKEFVYDNKLLSQFYSTIGDAQNQLRNHAASDSAYDKSLEADPVNETVLNNYAYYLSLRNQKLDKAEAMSKKSNDLNPNNHYYQDTYGWILYQMKKYDDAKLWIGKALNNMEINKERKSGTVLEHYGDILYQLGDKDNALNYWMDAKKAGGTSEFIDKKIADKKLYE
ncbi:MAG: tetratricopeptide repeat protein [Bacteroidota bacterium]